MKQIDHYNSNYNAFLKDLENSPQEHLPFKVFGPKKRKTGDFQSFSCIGQVYKQIENPDTSTNRLYQAPFGEIYKYGCRLSNDVFSVIQPNSKGGNQFQGDIFKLEDVLDFKVQTDLVLLMSHSCEVERENLVSVLPVYKESDLEATPTKVEGIRGKAPKDHKIIIKNWLTNENKIVVGLPPKDIDGKSERLAIYLREVKTVNKNLLPNDPVVRLSYRGLSYLQIRLSHFFFRDVQDSDESRSL